MNLSLFLSALRVRVEATGGPDDGIRDLLSLIGPGVSSHNTCTGNICSRGSLVFPHVEFVLNSGEQNSEQSDVGRLITELAVFTFLFLCYSKTQVVGLTT